MKLLSNTGAFSRIVAGRADEHGEEKTAMIAAIEAGFHLPGNGSAAISAKTSVQQLTKC
ncbi:hypothetical protein [uncultured Roseobacter sp.]|uniref:hypothetical protein n=1 Tax=uncultured Roseobacter sp. TaxID=114847 RepID=UPI002606DE3D|nr:hypothetical protein [uncultured Roseobacter sp.]